MAAEAAMSFAVEKLGNLMIEKVTFLQGVEEQVKRMKDELKRMQCFLKDAEEKQVNDERIRNWISEIREVAHDAEDAIETFILKVDNPRKSRGFLGRCACFPNHLFHLDRIGEEIESIRSRLQEIEQSRERYGVQNLGEGVESSTRSDAVESRRQLAHWQNDKHVVGLEKDVELLLRKAILEEREGLSAATIVGMGGIGKSTLARKVYNHADVVARFESRAWVSVSREFDPKEIIKELMLQLVGPKEDQLKALEIMDKSPLPHLKHMLHKRLQDKRYFIVLDDVWEQEAWESLATVFPNEDKASRLLFTSRNRVITKYTQYVHEMTLLDPNESWELFLKVVFINNTNDNCPEDLEGIGRQILKKCDGLPLAITVIGGLLVDKSPSKSKWEKVLKEINSHLGRSGSIVSTILELSYQDLSPRLKACFLCLSFFKEDATILAEKLIHLWIAEGLVPQEEEETMEETARSYLGELINRNMVQVKGVSLDDRVNKCQIHDLLHELSITKAKMGISFEILREGGKSQFLDKPRHRVVHCGTENFIYSANKNKHLRSLIFHGPDNVFHESVDVNPSYWKSFELLRILDFENFGLKKLSDAIGTLIGLRFLGLRNTSLKELPHSLGYLKNLEVLDIAKTIGVELPNVIWKLAALRHLYMSRIKCKLPLKIDTLKNLQTLTYIPADNWVPEHLAQMTSLHKLGIELDHNSDLRKLCTSLNMLENLSSRMTSFKIFTQRWSSEGSLPSLDPLLVNLHCLSLTQLKLDGKLTSLPSASNFPPNISSLSLRWTSLDEDPMLTLEKLPKLVHLELHHAYHGEKLEISPRGFPRLQVLSLRGLSRLQTINVGKDSMLELKRLEIRKCMQLVILPRELRFMTNLQELKIVTTAESASLIRFAYADIFSNIPLVSLIEISYDDSPITEEEFIAGLTKWLDASR